MRFEIRAGGGFLILLGLVGLSGAVFALGLVAGYEMARQNQPDLSQISSTYPLPNRALRKPAPVAEMSPAAAAVPIDCRGLPPPLAASKAPAPAIGEETRLRSKVTCCCRARETPAETPAVSPPATAEDEIPTVPKLLSASLLLRRAYALPGRESPTTFRFRP